MSHDKSLESLMHEIRRKSETIEKQYMTRLSKLEQNMNTLQKTITKLDERIQSKPSSAYSGMNIATFVLLLALFMFVFKDNVIQVYKQLNIEQPRCRNVTFYHWETQVPFTGTTKNCSISSASLLEYANKAFPIGPRLTSIVAATGEDLPPIVDYSVTPEDSSPMILVVLGEYERFIWPAENLNKTVYRTLGVPYFPHTVGIRPISKEPRLIELYNLLLPEECDHFYEKAKILEKEESKVGSDTQSAVKSLARTSSHTWMGREALGASDRWYTDEIINRVEDRIFELTRLDSSTSEPFQVVFYRTDQYYYGHHDYSTKAGTLNNPYYQGGGNRLITVLLYLNDVDQGGETTFPFVNEKGQPINRHMVPTELYEGATACQSGGVKVKPMKGGAIMFYNLKEKGHNEGIVDPWSLHAGCTVTKGEKYVSNKWIRNKRVNGKLYDVHW